MKRYPHAVAYNMIEKYQPVELPTTVNADSVKSRGAQDKRLPADTPVLGVVEDRHARAYPLQVLARLGLIRDIVDGKDRVLLWLEATRTAAAYRPLASPPKGVEGRPRSLILTIDRKEAEAPFLDKETGSRWDIAGRAVQGELKGWTLTWLDSTQVKWFAWAAEYPEASIYGK